MENKCNKCGENQLFYRVVNGCDGGGVVDDYGCKNGCYSDEKLCEEHQEDVNIINKLCAYNNKTMLCENCAKELPLYYYGYVYFDSPEDAMLSVWEEYYCEDCSFEKIIT